MKRLHVHIAVSDLERNITFYSKLFAAEPSVRKPDYAKWMLEDPRVNFAISARGREPGLDHLGLQVDASEELGALQERLSQAGESPVSEIATTCCYAKSDKHWVRDPQGIAWETFHTLGDSPTFGASRADAAGGTCRGPERAQPQAMRSDSSSLSASGGASTCCR